MSGLCFFLSCNYFLLFGLYNLTVVELFPFLFLLLMSGRKKKGASPPSAGLNPTISHNTLGDFIIVTCGSLAGNLYLSKLDTSNKSQSKCIVYSGKWYSPPEFETLAGKKARKWK